MLRKLKPRLNLILLAIVAVALTAFSLEGSIGSCVTQCLQTWHSANVACTNSYNACVAACNGNSTCKAGCLTQDTACAEQAQKAEACCQDACYGLDCE
jgi:hypothetical protein